VLVLDAFALIALLNDERAADAVERLLQERRCSMTTVNLAEVVDRLVRVDGRPEPRVRASLSTLLSEHVHAVVVDVPLAVRAATLRAAHHHRTRSPLSLADCMCLAAAGPEDALATADKPLLRAAEREGIETIALPR
jgi:PIN domain nuclease of toxin-antitoxin system